MKKQIFTTRLVGGRYHLSWVAFNPREHFGYRCSAVTCSRSLLLALVVVTAAFAFTGIIATKVVSLELAIAALLVPATMQVLGD